MAVSLEQSFYVAQQQLQDLNKNISLLCSRIFKDIQYRSSKETVALIKSKIESEGHLTKIELLDRVLAEYVEIVHQREADSTSRVNEYREEVEALKIANRRLKEDLRSSQEQSEELDRLNESLGGTGLTSFCSGEHREQFEQKYRFLQGELKIARQQLKQGEEKCREIQRRSVGNNMATNASASEMLKRVQALVPTFSGETSPSLHTDVYRFIDGVNLVLEGVTDATQKAACLKMIKQRMHGDAYNLVRLVNFADEKDLVKLVKNTYLKTRTLDSVYMEIWGASQKPNEDIRQYARRLQNLANIAKAIIKETYSNAQDEIVMTELGRKLRVAFIAGLRDQVVGSSLLHSPVSSLEGLMEEALVAQSTLWRGEEPPSARVNFAEKVRSEESVTMTSLVAAVQQLVNSNNQGSNVRQSDGEEVRFPPCSFCNKRGHTRENCWERQNTPYCDRCEEYGHDRGRSCRGSQRGYDNIGQNGLRNHGDYHSPNFSGNGRNQNNYYGIQGRNNRSNQDFDRRPANNQRNSQRDISDRRYSSNQRGTMIRKEGPGNGSDQGQFGRIQGNNDNPQNRSRNNQESQRSAVYTGNRPILGQKPQNSGNY